MSDYLLRDIIDELKKIRTLLESPQIALRQSLSLDEKQVEALTREIQAALLRQAKRNPKTGLRLKSRREQKEEQ